MSRTDAQKLLQPFFIIPVINNYNYYNEPINFNSDSKSS